MSVRERIKWQGLEGLRIGRIGKAVNSSFVVYRLGQTLIDTGPGNQWKYVRPFIEEQPVLQILLTHHHEDHSGNAARLKRLTGITPQAPAITVDILKKGFRIPPWQQVVWGKAEKVDCDPLPEKLSLPDGEPVTAVYAPGHAKDMTCYVLPDRGWLFSADLYLADYLKYLRADENIHLFLQSVKAVLAENFDVILCPHRGIVENGRARLQQKHDYIETLIGNAHRGQQAGKDITQITTELLGKEDMIAYITRGNFCKQNLIRSCLRDAA